MNFEGYFTGVASSVTATLLFAGLAALGVPLGCAVARQAYDLRGSEPTVVTGIPNPGIEQPHISHPPRERRPPDHEALVVRKTCVDSAGNEGIFDVVLFSRAYSWVRGETDAVELNETPADFVRLLRRSALGDYLRRTPEIIALGTASCEGYPAHLERELRRSEARANKLVGWIETVRPPRAAPERWKPVKAMVLGVFKDGCPTGGETWPQRRIVLIAVRERDDRLDLDDCLRRTLEEDDELSYLATSYTPGFRRSARIP